MVPGAFRGKSGGWDGSHGGAAGNVREMYVNLVRFFILPYPFGVDASRDWHLANHDKPSEIGRSERYRKRGRRSSRCLWR